MPAWNDLTLRWQKKVRSMPTATLYRGLAWCLRPVTSRASSAYQSLGARHVWVIGSVLALLSVAIAGLAIRDLHRWAIENARGNMRDLGIVLAEQTSRYVQVI